MSTSPPSSPRSLARAGGRGFLKAVSVGALAAALGACSLAFRDDALSGEPAGDAGAGGAAGGGAGASQGGAGGAAGGGAGGGAAGGGAGGGAAGVGGGAAGAGAGGGGAAGGGGLGGVDARPVSLDRCVLLMNMDEPAWVGEGAVKDGSGAGNDGAPVNAAATVAEGKFGRAGSFDGASWVEVADAPLLDGGLDALTYAAWVFPTEVPPEGAGIISKREGYLVNAAFTLFLYGNNQIYADIQDTRFFSNASVPLGQWSHVAVVYDGKGAGPLGRASIYFNGTFEASAEVPAALAPNAQNLLIGNLINGGDLFRGRIDEVAVWTRALDAAELKAIYEANRPL